MTKEAYKTRKGRTAYKPVLTESEYHAAENDNEGFCVACGETQYGCEPDARQYTCESCGERAVYGIPELLLMGVITGIDEG